MQIKSVIILMRKCASSSLHATKNENGHLSNDQVTEKEKNKIERDWYINFSKCIKVLHIEKEKCFAKANTIYASSIFSTWTFFYLKMKISIESHLNDELWIQFSIALENISFFFLSSEIVQLKLASWWMQSVYLLQIKKHTISFQCFKI